MNEIQSTIAAYLANRSESESPSRHDLLCFVGMLETGEATPADFDSVRSGLSAVVLEFQKKLALNL